MLGTLICPEKSTITNLICTHGGHHQDWTADYRLYSKDRVDEAYLFDKVRDKLLDHLAPGDPFVVGVDDTVARKTGKKIYGSSWKRDPLGPAFQTNLIHAQRYLQFSAAWPLDNGQARMIPIDFLHAPSPAKPKKDADPTQLTAYREALKQKNLNHQALLRLHILRDKIPASRRIVLTGDGSYPIFVHPNGEKIAATATNLPPQAISCGSCVMKPGPAPSGQGLSTVSQPGPRGSRAEINLRLIFQPHSSLRPWVEWCSSILVPRWF